MMTNICRKVEIGSSKCTDSLRPYHQLEVQRWKCAPITDIKPFTIENYALATSNECVVTLSILVQEAVQISP
jgi:hypothetical protein